MSAFRAARSIWVKQVFSGFAVRQEVVTTRTHSAFNLLGIAAIGRELRSRSAQHHLCGAFISHAWPGAIDSCPVCGRICSRHCQIQVQVRYLLFTCLSCKGELTPSERVTYPRFCRVFPFRPMYSIGPFLSDCIWKIVTYPTAKLTIIARGTPPRWN